MNEIGARTRVGTTLKVLAAALAVALVTPSAARAGTDMKDAKDLKEVCNPSCDDKDWTIELGSGGQWSNVRSGQPNKAYTVIPINLTASLKVDDVSLDREFWGVLRGYTEFFFRADYDQFVAGPDNHYEGIFVGPRYNFVQCGWRVIPYIEGGVGAGFADSHPQDGGLGQDFNFSFGAGAGAKFLITDCFFARLGVDYQHISNAGLSEPEFANHPIDALGPKLSFGYAF